MCGKSFRSLRGISRCQVDILSAFVVVLTFWIPAVPTRGQTFSVASSEIRPFVTALIPVVGRNGAVGGVSVNAAGVVTRSDTETLGRLRELRLVSLEKIRSELDTSSTMRKISLRGLMATIEARRRAGQPVTDELRNLAGLQRVEFVFVYPENNDIVLAGFAEGWKVDAQGNVVGRKTGHPVLQLDDLIVALRSAKNAATGDGITCSIDPSKEGAQRLERLLGTRGLQLNEATVARLEEALGQQNITLTGIPPSSHFACVLVAADFMLKRLGMNLESAPIQGMPSYMELLQASTTASTRNAMPRFWLAPRYDPLLKDADGLAWQLRGPGVQALAEDGYLKSGRSSTVSRAKSTSLAEQWAETMTAKYEPLSQAIPVFQELRNCMDLAVVAALLVKEDLPRKASCDLSLLLDDKRIQIASYPVPKTTDSRASTVRKGRDWIVSVSGGVAVDSWSVLNHVEVGSQMSNIRQQVALLGDKRWWWD